MNTSERSSSEGQDIAQALTKFVTYVQNNLKGYEKGEAQSKRQVNPVLDFPRCIAAVSASGASAGT